MTKMLTLQDLLQNKGVQSLDTVRIAGRDVTLAQKPHIEADVARANSVLSKLLANAPSSPSYNGTVTAVIPVINE